MSNVIRFGVSLEKELFDHFDRRLKAKVIPIAPKPFVILLEKIWLKLNGKRAKRWLAQLPLFMIIIKGICLIV